MKQLTPQKTIRIFKDGRWHNVNPARYQQWHEETDDQINRITTFMHEACKDDVTIVTVNNDIHDGAV